MKTRVPSFVSGRGCIRRALLMLPLVAAGCSTVAETGRSQLTFFPESYMAEMGAQAYQQETSQFPVITSGPQYDMVQRLGARISEAAGGEYAWEFRLLDAPDVANAFALPGGKVAIYSGILPITQNESGLAAVVGHEIAHVTAQHGNERMSQNAIASGVLVAADLALDSWTDLSGAAREDWMAALGMGAQVGVLLPFSREHESEADAIGLRYLIRAGYDPYEAPKLWERMAKLSEGSTPELLSTHPDPLKRAERLRELIPQFLEEEGR